MIEPRDLVTGRYMEVSKSFKKSTEAVLRVWIYESTNMIEKNSEVIEQRKKAFATGELRRTYRDAIGNITLVRKEVLKKSSSIPLPIEGADLNNFVTICYVLGCVMSNGERGAKSDDKLDGLLDKHK